MTGAGPSRRSHTKSRTGCKTCKRRHIRCDELFPQCRNCTKHQVRCDYMDTTEAESANQRNSIDERSVTVSSSAEDEIDAWKQTGVFPFPSLPVFPTPQAFDLTKDELRLVHHLCSITRDLGSADTANMTIWAEKIPKLLSIASSFPFVMHAILSFSANHLAWTQSSSDLRNLQVQHGGIALRGLLEATGSFSPANADAILSASMLMCWQATDWLSYSSLISGLHSVLNVMPPTDRDRFLSNVFPRESADNSYASQVSISVEERTLLLQTLVEALDQLKIYLYGHDLELHWIEQLLAYAHRLQGIPPALTAEEQFEHAYILRKWIYWVPISLLRRQGNKGPAVLVLAHLYAASVSLQPLFPYLTTTFLTSFATFPTSFTLPPLDAIIRMTDAMQVQQGASSSGIEIAALMQFPKRIVSEYRAQQGVPVASLSNAYLGVPGFGYVDNWGVVPSPGFPPVHQDSFGSYDSSEDIYPITQGFVQSIPIWT